MEDSEIEILKYELQWLYTDLREIIEKIPPQYHDLFEFKNKNKDDVIKYIMNEIHAYNNKWILKLQYSDVEIINNILIK